MSGEEGKLAALRAARDAARADLGARLQAAKGLTTPKVLGERLRADAEMHARSAMAQAMEIAADNRGVVAGTITALLLWAARKQVFKAAVQLAPKTLPFWDKAKAKLTSLRGEGADEEGARSD